MPRGRWNASEMFSDSENGPNYDEDIDKTNSRTIRRRRTTGKAAFNPSNLVSHGIANHAPSVEIGISFPLNPIAPFAHAANRLTRHGCEGRCRVCTADDQDWTVSPRQTRIISLKVLAHKRIALPAWLHHFDGGQLGHRPWLRAHLLDLVIKGMPLFRQHVADLKLRINRLNPISQGRKHQAGRTRGRVLVDFFYVGYLRNRNSSKIIRIANLVLLLRDCHSR